MAVSKSNKPAEALDSGIDSIAASLVSIISPKGSNKNFYLEPEHAAVVADLLKCHVAIYNVTPCNPIQNNKKMFVRQLDEEAQSRAGRVQQSVFDAQSGQLTASYEDTSKGLVEDPKTKQFI